MKNGMRFLNFAVLLFCYYAGISAFDSQKAGEAKKYDTLAIRPIFKLDHDYEGWIDHEETTNKSIACDPTGKFMVLPNEKDDSFTIINSQTKQKEAITPDWVSIIAGIKDSNATLFRIPLERIPRRYSGAAWSSQNTVAIIFNGGPSYALLYRANGAEENIDAQHSRLNLIKAIYEHCDIGGLAFSKDGNMLALGLCGSIYPDRDTMQEPFVIKKIDSNFNLLHIVDAKNGDKHVPIPLVGKNEELCINLKNCMQEISCQAKKIMKDCHKTPSAPVFIFVCTRAVNWTHNNVLAVTLHLRAEATLNGGDNGSDVPVCAASEQCTTFDFDATYKNIIINSALHDEKASFSSHNYSQEMPWVSQRHLLSSDLSSSGDTMLLCEKWSMREGHLEAEEIALRMIRGSQIEKVKYTLDDQKLLHATLLLGGDIAFLTQKDDDYALAIKNMQDNGSAQETYILPKTKPSGYKKCIVGIPQSNRVILVRENSETGQEEIVFVTRDIK